MPAWADNSTSHSTAYAHAANADKMHAFAMILLFVYVLVTQRAQAPRISAIGYSYRSAPRIAASTTHHEFRCGVFGLKRSAAAARMRLRKSASVARASTLFANSSLSSSESAIISAAPRSTYARALVVWWLSAHRNGTSKAGNPSAEISARDVAPAREIVAVGRTQGFRHAVLVRHHGPGRTSSSVKASSAHVASYSFGPVICTTYNPSIASSCFLS